MRRYLLLLALLLGICLLNAQQLNLWQNFRHSSRDAEGKIHIRWDNPGAEYLNLEFFAKTVQETGRAIPSRICPVSVLLHNRLSIGTCL